MKVEGDKTVETQAQLIDKPRAARPTIKFIDEYCAYSRSLFSTESPWQAQQLRFQRLHLALQGLKGRKISLIIDETGDKKKGKSTDYVSRQYLGKLGKIDNGMLDSLIDRGQLTVNPIQKLAEFFHVSPAVFLSKDN